MSGVPSFSPKYVSAASPAKWFEGLVIAGMAVFLVAMAMKLLPSDERVRMTLIGTYEFLACVGGVVFLVWEYRAIWNLRALGVSGHRFTTGWDLLYWFIPILNLFRPYQVVQETWRASNPSADVEDGAAWKTAKGSALIGWWWPLHLSLYFFGLVLPRKDSSEAQILGRPAMVGLCLGYTALYFGAAVLVIVIVRQIAERQDEKRRRSPVVAPPAWVPPPSREEDLPSLEEAVRRDANDAQALFALGEAYYRSGRWDDAAREFYKATSVAPTYADAHNNLGAAFARSGRWDDATLEFKTAIRLKHDYADAHDNLAAAYAHSGQWEGVIAETKEALRIEPRRAQSHYNLGLAYLKSGSREAALQVCGALRRLDANLADQLLKQITPGALPLDGH